MTSRDSFSTAAGVATALACATLFPLYDSVGWVPPVMGAILVVALASIGARRLRVPDPLAPVAVAVAVLVYLTAVFASGVAVLGVLPGPAALRALGDIGATGLDDVQHLASPVPARQGLVLLAVIGVALVALVADMIAATLRRPPLAGLPLLALFAVPAALLPDGLGVLPFVVGVAGYLVLLAADHRDRLGRWGRRLRTSAQLERTGIATAAAYGEDSGTGSPARRIGAVAIGLAVVVPALLPQVRPPVFLGNGSAGTGRGVAHGVTTYNPIVRLKDELTEGDPVPLLRIHTDDADPVPYLRLAGLDRFDGSTWSQTTPHAPRSARVPQALPHATVSGPAATTTIEVGSRLEARWLPLPYQTTDVDVRGDWRYDGRTGTVFSSKDSVRERKITTRNVRLTPDPEALRDAPDAAGRSDLQPYLEVPKGLPREIVATAASVTRSAATPYDKAAALQRFFRTDFTYSLQVPAGNSDDAMVAFLHYRRGFCEQFAATMALLARLNGIPARVAVGFTYGKPQSDGSYLVTTRDAHAWPELYFSGAGWLPFEPTPVAGRGTSVAPPWTQPPDTSAGSIGSGGDAAATGSGRSDLNDKKFNSDTDPVISGGASSPRLPSDILLPATPPPPPHRPLWPWALGGGVAVALLALPAALRLAVRRGRRRRWRTRPAEAAWADLRDDARDLRLAWPDSASPRGVQAWLGRHADLDDRERAALGTLVVAQERACYARPGLVSADGGGLSGAERLVRAALVRSVSRPRRLLAAVFPASALDRLGRTGLRGLDVLDRVERATALGLRRLARRPGAAVGRA